MFKNLKQKLENQFATSPPSKTSSMPTDEGKGEEKLQQSAAVNSESVKTSEQKSEVANETCQSDTLETLESDLLALTKEELEKTNRVLLGQVKELEDAKNDAGRRMSRRLGELEEQIHLDRQAKRDLEHSYALMLDEKDELITVLKTQVQLLKSNQPMNLSTTSEDRDDQTTDVADGAVNLEEFAVLKEKVKRLEALLTKCKDTIKTNKEKSKQLAQEKEELEKSNEEKVKEMQQKHDKEMKSKMADLREEIRALTEVRSGLNNQLVHMNSQMSEKEKAIELKEKDFNAKMEKVQSDMERLNATFKRSQEKTMKGLKSQSTDPSATEATSEEAIAFDASEEMDKMKELYDTRGKELVQVLEERNNLRKELNGQRQRFASVLERYDEQMKVVQGELTERMKPGPMEATLMKEVWSILSGVPYLAPTENPEEKKDTEKTEEPKSEIESISESAVEDLRSETVPRKDLEAAQNKLEHVLSLLERCAKQMDSREAFDNRWKERLAEAESKASEQQRVSQETIERLNGQILELTARENVLNANLERARQESDAVLQQQRTEMAALQSNLDQLKEKEKQLGSQIQRTKMMCDAEVARVSAEHLESVQHLSENLEETQSTLSGLAKELIESRDRSEVLISSLEGELNEKCNMLQRMADYIDASSDDALKAVFFKIVVECSPPVENTSAASEVTSDLPETQKETESEAKSDIPETQKETESEVKSDIPETQNETKSEVTTPKVADDSVAVSPASELSAAEMVSVENCKSTVATDKKEVVIESRYHQELINFDIQQTNPSSTIQKDSKAKSTDTFKNVSLLNSDIVAKISRRKTPSGSPVHVKSSDNSSSESSEVGNLMKEIEKLKSNLHDYQQRCKVLEIGNVSMGSIKDSVVDFVIDTDEMIVDKNVVENKDAFKKEEHSNIEKDSKILEKPLKPESSIKIDRSQDKDAENKLFSTIESLQIENELLKRKIKEHEERSAFNASLDSLKLELETVSSEASKLKIDLGESETRLMEMESLQEKLAQSELESKCKDKDNEEAKESLERMKEELELNVSIIRNLEEEMSRKEAAALDLKDLSTEFKKLQEDCNFERSENQKLVERISYLEIERKKDSKAFEELSRAKETLQFELDASAKCFSEQRKISEDLQVEINSLKDVQKQKEISNINFSESVNNLTKDIEGLLLEKQDLFSTIETLRLENANLHNTIADLNKTLEMLRSECASHLEKVDSKKSELEEVATMRQKDEVLIKEMKERLESFEQMLRDFEDGQVSLSEKVALIQKLEDKIKSLVDKSKSDLENNEKLLNKKNQILSLCFDNLSNAQLMLNDVSTNVTFLSLEVRELKNSKSELENTLNKQEETVSKENDELIISLRDEINLLQMQIHNQNEKPSKDNETSTEPLKLPLPRSSEEDPKNIDTSSDDRDADNHPPQAEMDALKLALTLKDKEIEGMKSSYETLVQKYEEAQMDLSKRHVYYNNNVTTSLGRSIECNTEFEKESHETSENSEVIISETRKLEKLQENIETFDVLSAAEETSYLNPVEEKITKIKADQCHTEPPITSSSSNDNQEREALSNELQQVKKLLEESRKEVEFLKQREMQLASPRRRSKSQSSLREHLDSLDLSQEIFLTPEKSSKNGKGSYASVDDHHQNLVDLSPLNRESALTPKVESGNEKSDSDLLELSEGTPSTPREYEELHKRFYLLAKEVERLNTELHFYYANSHLKHHHHHHHREQIDKHDSFLDLTEPTELEYLRNVLYKYMLGTETKTLAKVICMVVRFSTDQTKRILDFEESKTGIFSIKEYH